MKKPKLKDPFWTSGIVNLVEQFWGREAELEDIEENIRRSGITISGTVGIGKSSLMSMMRLHLEGFGVDVKCVSMVVMCSKGDEPWQLAKKLHNYFKDDFTKTTSERGLDLKGFKYTVKKEELALTKDDFIQSVDANIAELSKRDTIDFILLCFDEAHKCPAALASLVRELKEKWEHAGVNKVRFITAGIGAYHEHIYREDTGIGRAFQNRIHLKPWNESDTRSFLHEKLSLVVAQSKESGIPVSVRGSKGHDLDEIIYGLSGGHPFLTQLLGSYLIRHENKNPDDVLSPKDLSGAMEEICSVTREAEYKEMIELLEIGGVDEVYESLIYAIEHHSPSRIPKKKIGKILGDDSLKWFVENGFLFDNGRGEFQLTDELLRVKVMFDENSDSSSDDDPETGTGTGGYYFDDPIDDE